MKLIMGTAYFSVDEVAEMFNVSSKTIREWTWKGKLQSTKIGGRVLYTKDSLQDYINKIK